MRTLVAAIVAAGLTARTASYLSSDAIRRHDRRTHRMRAWATGAGRNACYAFTWTPSSRLEAALRDAPMQRERLILQEPRLD